MNFLFISAHCPTYEQIKLAKEHGVKLHFQGDLDAFDPELESKIAWQEDAAQGHLAFQMELDTGKEVDPSDLPAFEGVVAMHGLICATAARMSYKLGFFNGSEAFVIFEV